MNYYGVTRSTDHLAHYGVKGMKWGVQRAVARKNDKALDRHYKKAAKKLAKLQDIGLDSPKYAKRALAYGAAATGTGTLTIKGPELFKKALEVKGFDRYVNYSASNFNGGRPVAKQRKLKAIVDKTQANNRKYQLATGLVTAGLLGAAGVNAYRALNGPKYRAKAVGWKNAMDDTFKGTKYEGKYVVPVKKKKLKVRHSDASKSTTFDEFSNPDFLAHYGIRGMKWGVRKAIASGNDNMLDRQYRKAAKKLEKLSKRANVEAQDQQAQKYNKIAKKAGKIGAAGVGVAIAGTGTNHTLHYINTLHKKLTQHQLKDIEDRFTDLDTTSWNAYKYLDKQRNKELKEKKLTETILPEKKLEEKKLIEEKFNADADKLVKEHDAKWDEIENEYDATRDNFNSAKDKRKFAADVGKYVGYAGAGLGALGLGASVIAKAKAHAAKKRMTSKGHAKAIAERDAWRKEMQSAFKGTKYQNLPKVNKKRRKKNNG